MENLIEEFALIEDGIYELLDDETAAKALRQFAEQGGAAAQTALGSIYANGQGVPQDYSEAAKWFRLAAEQGVAQAQSDLAIAYAQGEGTSRR